MREIHEETTKNIETVAKQEFLELGFEGASLRNIVNKIGISTQTIYLRYENKDGLFSKLVENTADEFLNLYKSLHESVSSTTRMEHSSQATDSVLDYIYDHLDDFKLIFLKSKGSKYENYIYKLIKIEEKAMNEILKNIDYSNSKLPKFFIHKKATEGLNDLYEIIYHDLDKSEAKAYMNLVKTYRFAGWKAILSLSE